MKQGKGRRKAACWSFLWKWWLLAVPMILLLEKSNRVQSFSPVSVSSRPPVAKAASTLLLLRSPRASKLFLKPSTITDALVEQVPSQTIVNAVEQLSNQPNNNKLLVSDVAATAGLSLAETKQELTTLAALSQADLAVSPDGELLYEFPNNLSTVLASNSAKYSSIQTFKKVWPGLFWFLRVTFGVALLASLVAVFSTIVFIQSSSSDDNRRRDDRGIGGGFGGMNSWYWGPSPFDFFYYRPYGSYGYYNTNRDPDEMGFLESVFSYVFGDGNPNANLEEQRLKFAAHVIRNNKGAVTAEQLAPFVDDAPNPKDDSNYVDESFVLPIVSSLGGEPVVSEDGEIVYVFEDLQTTATTDKLPLSTSNKKAREALVLKKAGMRSNASSRDIARVLNYNGISTRGIVEKQELVQLLEENLPDFTPSEELQLMEGDPTVLVEREWKFSLANDLNKVLAGGLGVVNLGGALYLGNLLAQYVGYGVRLPAYFGAVQAGYPFLLGYALLFNLIPLARNAWIKRENEKIRQRNKVRKSWQAVLATSIRNNPKLAKKLQAAAKLQRKRKQLSSSDVIYDTKQNIENVRQDKSLRELDEFDKLLGDDTSSFQ